jgi:hypothetical protein
MRAAVVVISNTRCEMAKKRKPRFRAANEARRRARLDAGMPPAERTIPDKREKPPKHKKSPLTFIEE